MIEICLYLIGFEDCLQKSNHPASEDLLCNRSISDPVKPH